MHFITPVQIGKIYMKHFQGWLSGVTKPAYAANVEGGGGKVMLMPSGHDTTNVRKSIEDEISKSYATVSTWDDRKLSKYEALGRTTRAEYDEAVKIMDEFIGRSGVFLPKLIIIDDNGNHEETTNRSKLPKIHKRKKARLLNYKTFKDDMPLTNPAEIMDQLDVLFHSSTYNIKMTAKEGGRKIEVDNLNANSSNVS